MSGDSTLPVEAGAVPYVGLRPYGRAEREWFFGRDGDAQVLIDKVLSARLTLMYAPSGVGKSSMLQAGVIPGLEQEDCRVQYFDAWSGSDPLAALKQKLAKMAAEAGIADPQAGAPTLVELARLVTDDRRTLVLALDQFEEFLINHAQDLDPLRRELAALVRAKALDVRILICLREEFLAALEPFRPDILTLFQSTDRLESLTPEQVRTVIVAPAERFLGEVEPALVNRLIDDLSEGPADAAPARAGTAGGTTPRAAAPRGWRRSALLRGAAEAWSSTATALRELWPGRRAASAAPEPDEREPILRTNADRTIDLPMLQLVLEHMWNAAAPTAGRPERRLTLELYRKKLGGKSKILAEHIRSRMPRHWRDRVFTAQLMRYLAPPSGLKISYSAADLAFASGLDEPRIDDELRRLADARVLRTRKLRRSDARPDAEDDTADVRYELQHDALVRHIAPWRDAVLRKAGLARRAGMLGIAVLMGLVFFGWRQWDYYTEVRQNTDDPIAQLQGMPESERLQHAPVRFEGIANYLLNQDPGAKRFDRLKALLEKHHTLLPPDYLTAVPPQDGFATARLGDNGLALRYSPARGLNADAFSQAWGEAAQRLTRRWGIPVPRRIALVADDSLPDDAVRLEAGGEVLLALDLAAYDERALVQMSETRSPVREFRDRFRQEWERPALMPAALSKSWWSVPRWSLPVWRVGGYDVRAGGAYPAYALEAQLQQDPSRLLTPVATYALVQHVATQYPCTAAEAWAARGSRLQADLVAWMRGGEAADGKPAAGPARALTHPHLLLDVLATGDARLLRQLQRAPDLSAASFATLREPPGAVWPRPSARGHTACALAAVKPDALDLGAYAAKIEDTGAYRDVEGWLPPMLPKVRLVLGAELVRAWSADARLQQAAAMARALPGGKEARPWPKSPSTGARDGAEPALVPDQNMGVNSALTQVFERQRRVTYLRNGVWLPDASFGNAALELAGAGSHPFRIALLATPGRAGLLQDAGSADAAGIERVVANLENAVSAVPRAWLDVEYVGQLVNHDPTLQALAQDWLPAAGDLTELLRAVVGAGDGAGAPASPEARTIRDPAWLLHSLVFWRHYAANAPKAERDRLLSTLAQRLRQLQAHRGVPADPARRGGAAADRGVSSPLVAGPAAGPRPAAALIERGVSALNAGRVNEADDLFEKALKLAPPSAAAQTFIALYGARWPASVRQRAERHCRRPTAGGITDARLQAELEDWLGTPGLPAAEARPLALCLLASMPATLPLGKAELQMATATRHGDPPAWPPQQAWWFAMELLKRYDPTRDPPAVLAEGTRYLDAVLRRPVPRGGDADASFNELYQLCQQPGPKGWCRELLGRYATTRMSAWMAIDLAFMMVDRPNDIPHAFSWLARAGERAAKGGVSAAERPRFDFYVDLIRAHANNERLGAGERVEIADDLMRRAETLRDDALKQNAMRLALDAALRAEPLDRARLGQLYDLAQTAWPTEPMLLADGAEAALRLGDANRIHEAVERACKLAQDKPAGSPERAVLLGTAAYAGLVGGEPCAPWAAEQYIQSGAQNAPLIAILLATRARAAQPAAPSQPSGSQREPPSAPATETKETRERPGLSLKERWKRVDPSRWAVRLEAGDEQVWYEMLLGYLAGAVPQAEVFGPLRDEAAFRESRLSRLGFNRSGALTEANFYEALRHLNARDLPAARTSLQKVVDSGSRRYTEYAMAVQLLRESTAANGAGAASAASSAGSR